MEKIIDAINGFLFDEILFRDLLFFVDGVELPLVVTVLILGAIFFTIYFKFPNLRLLGTAINVVRGKYDHLESDETGISSNSVNTVDGDIVDTIKNESEKGEVSHFQALTSALSATVGLGNIAGVAAAISLGGPGATFWMIIAGFLGMSSKFVECTLGVAYREIDKNGTVYGGPMYYLSRGLKEKNLGTLGFVLSIIFAVMCIGGSLGAGNMFQANQAATMFFDATGLEFDGDRLVFGIVIMVLVGLVILGGIKRIGKFSELIVPFMCGLYVLTAIIIIFLNIKNVPAAFQLILSEAFNMQAGIGGVVGVLIVGFQRAAFSNEAGEGSASIAHAAVKTDYPASEGIVALLEPFVDTIIVCTMTALVIILTNIDHNIIEYGVKTPSGVEATARAFDMNIPYASYVLALAVILFAFSTMLSWSYYGLQAWDYLWSMVSKNKNIGNIIFKVVFCLAILVGTVVETLGPILDFADAMVLSMVFPNIIGLIFLAPVVKRELDRYLKRIKS